MVSRLWDICLGSGREYILHQCRLVSKFSSIPQDDWLLTLVIEADDYTQNLNEDAPGKSRAVLLNRVIVGNPKRRRRNAVHLTAPPLGCHSVRLFVDSIDSTLSDTRSQVIGEPGADLNYEETVVYHNDAIRPAYLIIYCEQTETIKPKLRFRNAVKALFNTPLVT